MGRINISQNEFKVLRALTEDSRLSINEIAKLTNLNRNTVRTAIASLVSNKTITRFTVDIARGNDEKYILIETDDIEGIPEEDRIEVLHLSNGKFMVTATIDVLHKDLKYDQINVINKVEMNSRIYSSVKPYCDYCGKEINEGVLVLKVNNHEYYACCTNCRRDLERRLSRES